MNDLSAPYVHNVFTKLNIACYVSLSRLLLLPIALLSVLLHWPHGLLIAALVCIAAGLTDILDGYLARSKACVSDLGSALDLLTDKLFVSSMLILLAAQGIIPYWLAVAIVLREIIISLVRLPCYFKRQSVSSNPLGKAKMVASMVAIVGLLVGQDIREGGLLAPMIHSFSLPSILDLAWWVTLLALALTWLSGAHYLLSCGQYLSNRGYRLPNSTDPKPSRS